MEAKEDSPFVAYARRELELAGLFDEDSDYNGMIAKSVMRLIETFAAEGHSGASASLSASLFYRLAQWKPLSSITDDPEEWQEVTNEMYPPEKIAAGDRIWQSRRSPSTFSTDAGKHWADKELGTKGKSVTKEDRDAAKHNQSEEKSANGVSGPTTEQGKQSSQSSPTQSTGSPQADSATGVSEQPTTQPQSAPVAGGEQKSGNLVGGQQAMEGHERPNDNKPAQARAQKGAPGTPSKKTGGAKGGSEK